MTINIIPFFSVVSQEGLSKDVLRELEQEDVKFLTIKDKIPSDEPVFIFIGTGGTENDVSEFIESQHLNQPIIILSYDERNSLPAAMEIRTFLQQKGITARIIHKPLVQLHGLLSRWSKYEEIRKYLRKAKIGVIGEPSSWLIASTIDRKEVAKRWGIEIKGILITELTHKLPQSIDNGFAKQIKEFQSKSECQSITDENLEKGVLVAQRMQELITEQNLAAVTVQCFTLLQETEISGCYALSFLNDIDNFVAGCEGDLPATFTMLVAKLLTGKPSFMANVASVDQDLNTAVFAHCTTPISITEKYEITNHFETGMSVGIRGTLPLTDVTVVKIFGEDLSQYWVSGGTIIDNLVNDKGCRTQIRVALDEPVEYFLEESLANHHIVILGDFVDDVIEFFEFVN